MRQHRPDLHSLAAAYALHALDPEEREDFAAHLAHCEECRGDVAGFEETAARLAAAAGQHPPEELKRRTLDAVEGVRQLPPRVPATGRVPRLVRTLRRRAVPLGLAAGLAAATVLGGLVVRQHQENEDARLRAGQAERRLEAVGAVLAAPDARTAHGRTTDGALATVVTSERRNQAVFAAAGLPAPARGHTYQLWLGLEGTMRPAGFLHADGTVLLDGDPAGATAVGLTVEPSGGSARPTTRPLLLLALPS
ncbi:anti-sigma factor [Streptomyces termitum]|uniref:anti-sigma factor n=1 Tax=Streptomyces termitum TaxID=67368 RepID=UPI0037961D54